jgi:hypothetical protein
MRWYFDLVAAAYNVFLFISLTLLKDKLERLRPNLIFGAKFGCYNVAWFKFLVVSYLYLKKLDYV